MGFKSNNGLEPEEDGAISNWIKKLIIPDVGVSEPICKFCSGTKTDPMSEHTDFVCVSCH
mgnify:CR=1 FL=1|tara:strand:+ start:83 stop:262 length:180 start_codon:yes stop_codon:yes gene_type:complete